MRTQRSFQNLSTRLIGTCLSLGLSLVATPLVLRWLGDQTFGSSRMLTDWFGYLSLLEMGLSGGMLPLFAQGISQGEGEPNAIHRALQAAIRVYFGVAAAMLVCGLLITLGCAHLVPVPPGSRADLRVASLIFLLQYIAVPLTPLRTLVDASQRGHRINLLLFAQGAVSTGLSLLFARWGLGISGQSLALVIGYLCFSFTLSHAELRKFPGILRQSLFQKADPTVLRSLHRLNGEALLLDICGKVSYYADNIIVGLILGPLKVVPFVMTQRLAQVAQGQLLGVGNATWAALAELHFQQRRDIFRQRVIDLTGLVSGAGVALLVPICLVNRGFISLWVGPGRFGGNLITFLAASNALFTAVWSLWGWCFSGTGMNRRLLRISIAWGAVNVVSSVGATFLIGLPGPLIGTFVSFLLVPFWATPLVMRGTFGIPPLALIGALARPMAFGTAYFLLARAIARALPLRLPAGWLGLVLEAAASGIAYLLLWWRIGMGIEERRAWTHRLGFVISRLRTAVLTR